MKLTAKPVPYSSIVGGGLALKNERGEAVYLVTFMGTTQGITKKESDELARQFADYVNKSGLDVSSRPGTP